MANTRRRNRVGWGGDTTVSAATADALDLLSYDPNPVPEDDKDLRRYINDELFKIRDSFYEILDNMSNGFDYDLDIAKGLVAGHSSVNKFGRNGAIVADGTEWIVSSGSIAYIRASADITHIWADVDSASSRDIDVTIQGLDTNWEEAEATVTTDVADSTTSVAIGSSFLRVYRMWVTSGSADIANNINVGDSGKTFFGAQIPAWSNQTLMAAYTVPANKTAYMTSFYASANPATNKDPTTLNIVLLSTDNENSQSYRIKHVNGLDLDATSIHHHGYSPYKKFTEKTDIWMQARTVAKAADVSAGFDLILVEDGY